MDTLILKKWKFTKVVVFIGGGIATIFATILFVIILSNDLLNTLISLDNIWLLKYFVGLVIGLIITTLRLKIEITNQFVIEKWQLLFFYVVCKHTEVLNIKKIEIVVERENRDHGVARVYSLAFIKSGKGSDIQLTSHRVYDRGVTGIDSCFSFANDVHEITALPIEYSEEFKDHLEKYKPNELNK